MSPQPGLKRPYGHDGVTTGSSSGLPSGTSGTDSGSDSIITPIAVRTALRDASLRSYQHSEKHVVSPRTSRPPRAHPHGPGERGGLANSLRRPTPRRSDPHAMGAKKSTNPFKDALQNAPSRTRWLVLQADPASWHGRVHGTENANMRGSG